eukprot:m.215997 g.215997  ORF g.215997 m.215997 type:complete len:717 (-) comp33201_c0_seq1:96-2246(-)
MLKAKTMIGAVLYMTIASTIGAGEFTDPDADEWSLVMRHKTPFHADGGWFTPGVTRYNADDESAGVYSIIDSVEDFRRDDGYLYFKLSYPGMCELAINAPCVEGKNYVIWKQTSNPYTKLREKEDTVQGYVAIDVVYDLFGGLTTTKNTNALFCGQPDQPNWWYAVGGSVSFRALNYIPAMRGNSTYGSPQLIANHMELSVWGRPKFPRASPLWKKVFRHVASAGAWCTDCMDKNTGDANNDLFSNLTQLPGYTHDNGVYVFKLEYPNLCTTQACDGGRDYMTWQQTSNPLEYATSVTDYAPLDMGSYDGGDDVSVFKGLAVGSTQDLPLLSPSSTIPSAWSVGEISTYAGADGNCGKCLPGPMTKSTVLDASIVELYVWGDLGGLECDPDKHYLAFEQDVWVCKDFTSCVKGATYEFKAPTAVSDRMCMNVRECDFDGQYELETPTLLDDRECAAFSQCSAFEFEALPATTTSDRACLQTTRCPSEEMPEAVAPTATTDRRCGCGDDMVAKNGVCTWSKNCSVSSEFLLAHANGDEDTVCGKVTKCNSNEFMSAASTSTSDAVCVAVTTCDSSTQEQLTAPTLSTDRVCGDKCNTCMDPTSQLQSACTSSKARDCVTFQTPQQQGTSPSIQTEGSDISITPAANGKVNVEGALNLGGADVGKWLTALQAEIFNLRASSMQDKQVLQNLRVDTSKQIVSLQNRVASLEAEVVNLST